MWVEDWIETDKTPPPYHTKIVFYDTDGNKFYKSDITHWTHMLPTPDKIKQTAL